MARGVRLLGVALLVVGSATWAWVAMLEDPVDRAVAPVSGTSGGIGMVELELYVLDLRLAPLLLAVVGVGLLVAPSVPGYAHGLCAMAAAAVAALVVSVGAGRLSAWWVGAVALTVVLGGIAALTIRLVRSPRTEGGTLSSPARRVTATAALVLLCSAFPLEVFVDFDDPVLAALPDGYLDAVAALEAVVLVAGALALLLAARRLTWLHLVACGSVAAELAALLSRDASGLAMALSLSTVVTASAAAVAGERGRVWCRPVALTAGLALLYPVAAWFAIVLGVGLGAIALTLNGGAIDYDGLPIFLSGPLSAALPVALYLVGTRAEAEQPVGRSRARRRQPAGRHARRRSAEALDGPVRSPEAG